MTSDSYQIRFDDRDGYLFAEVSADTIDDRIAAGYLEEVVERCHETGVKKLILVRNIPVILPIGSLYFATKNFQEALLDIQIAFVNPYSIIEKEMHFVALMGNNHGGRFGVYDNVEEAAAWLRVGI